MMKLFVFILTCLRSWDSLMTNIPLSWAHWIDEHSWSPDDWQYYQYYGR